VAVHGPVLRAADDVVAALQREPVAVRCVELAGLEVVHDLAFLLVNETVGEDQVGVKTTRPRRGLEPIEQPRSAMARHVVNASAREDQIEPSLW